LCSRRISSIGCKRRAKDPYQSSCTKQVPHRGEPLSRVNADYKGNRKSRSDFWQRAPFNQKDGYIQVALKSGERKESNPQTNLVSTTYRATDDTQVARKQFNHVNSMQTARARGRSSSMLDSLVPNRPYWNGAEFY